MNAYSRELMKRNVLEEACMGYDRFYTYLGELSLDELTQLIEPWGYKIVHISPHLGPRFAWITMEKRY